MKVNKRLIIYSLITLFVALFAYTNLFAVKQIKTQELKTQTETMRIHDDEDYHRRGGPGHMRGYRGRYGGPHHRGGYHGFMGGYFWIVIILIIIILLAAGFFIYYVLKKKNEKE
jgi:uncharacterized membrane protein